MTDNTERENFERTYAEGKSVASLTYIFDRWSNGDYAHKIVEQCWRLWLRRAALSKPAAGGAVGEAIPGTIEDVRDTLISSMENIAYNQTEHEYVKRIMSQAIAEMTRLRVALRATAAPDESRELALIEFVKSYMDAVCDDYENDNAGALAAFNESRKR